VSPRQTQFDLNVERLRKALVASGVRLDDGDEVFVVWLAAFDKDVIQAICRWITQANLS
jgi:hypothetical protein